MTSEPDTRDAAGGRLAVPDLTATVLTMTPTGLGADIRAVFGEGARVRGAARTAARTALGRRLLAVAARGGTLYICSVYRYMSEVFRARSSAPGHPH